MSRPPASANLATALLAPNLAWHPDKTAFVDSEGEHDFSTLAERAHRIAGGLLGLGLQPADRILLCMLDSADLVAAFLGAIDAGLVPVLLNTLMTSDDYAYLLNDTAAVAIIVSQSLWPAWREAVKQAGWPGRVIIDGSAGDVLRLADLYTDESIRPSHTARPNQTAFWLYSSGSTGRPKGVMHSHASVLATVDLFARGVLGLNADDVVYSAAKLFFAYGLGNALTFPMGVGATTILYPHRATPEAVSDILLKHKVTVFCGVPTLFAAMLASPHLPLGGFPHLRLCTSAGEALPQSLGEAWTKMTGVDIVDGIGSTEMLHIFVSNRLGTVRYGTTGHPVPGYEVKLVDEAGRTPPDGQIGELWVKGPSMTQGYWNKPAKNAETFDGDWMRTGDKFWRDADGALVHTGRADDMLKVSGIWVSPAEVENALLSHPAILEAAVIGVADGDGLIKPKAFLVLKESYVADDALRAEMQAFIKARLAPHKYPRLVEFVADLPKTATGKIRRHVLREREAHSANG